jgi:siroheme synthase (precorrin-2 oxidase/ferrochelatase)
MLKTKKSLLLLSLGAVVLVIGGGVTAYWLLVQRNRSLANAPVQLIPQDALVTASISTDPEQWQQLRQYGTPETRAALDKQLTQIRDELLTANGYNYEKDIQPWLGKAVTIAYLGLATPPISSNQGQLPPSKTPYLPDIIVLPIENSAQAKQLLEKTKAQKATQFFERTYRGVQIRETQRSNAQNFSAAVLGRFFVVTNNPKTIERAIDTYQGAPSIASTPRYSEELEKMNSSKSFAQVYLNVPAAMALAAANSKRNLAPEKVAAEQQGQGIATTVTLEPEGVRFQGSSWLKPKSSQKYRVENATSRLPRRLPADTLLMLSGSNLGQLWQDYVQSAETNPLTPIPPANLNAGLKATVDLDVEEDLLPWMEGEFTLALIPASPEALASPENRQFPPLGAGVVLMVEARDRNRARAALQKLDSVMATRYQFQVAQTKLGNYPVVSWLSPLGGVSATHGWLEGNVVFLTLGAPITSAIVPQPPATLTQTPLFQQAVPTEPRPNNGQFFLDVERTINNGNLNLAKLPPQPRMLAKAIRAIGVTGAINDQRTQRFDLFVQLKKTITPSVSPSPKASITFPSSPAAPSTPKASQTPASSSPALPTPKASQTPASSPPVPPTPEPSQTPSGSSSSPAAPQTPSSSPSAPVSPLNTSP